MPWNTVGHNTILPEKAAGLVLALRSKIKSDSCWWRRSERSFKNNCIPYVFPEAAIIHFFCRSMQKTLLFQRWLQDCWSVPATEWLLCLSLVVLMMYTPNFPPSRVTKISIHHRHPRSWHLLNDCGAANKAKKRLFPSQQSKSQAITWLD